MARHGVPLALLDLPQALLESVAGLLCAREYCSFVLSARDCHAAACGSEVVQRVATNDIARRLMMPPIDALQNQEVIVSMCGKCPHLILPATVERIHNKAFEGAPLLSIKAPGVTSIGERAFAGSTLASAEFPSLSAMGDYCFHHCASLTSIELPASVTHVNGEAFFLCDALASISIPGVKTIGEYAFCGCRSLTSVSPTTNLVSIGYSAFLDCERLVSIDLPPSLTTVHNYAFENCPALDAHAAMKARIRAINPRAGPTPG